jgi:uncharacterized OB-fold protein
MKLNPEGGPEARYRKALDGGRFLIQRCGNCGRHVFYPREVCPHCSAEALEFVEPKGTGTVYSTTVVRRKADAGGDYNVALVDLDEGVRMMSRVEGVAPPGVAIGMRVKAKVITVGDVGLVVFQPADVA